MANGKNWWEKLWQGTPAKPKPKKTYENLSKLTFEQIIYRTDLSDKVKAGLIQTYYPERYEEWVAWIKKSYPDWVAPVLPGMRAQWGVVSPEAAIEQYKGKPLEEAGGAGVTTAPQVISQGGYDWQNIITGYDKNGNPIYDWELIGETPTASTREWENYLAQAQREYEFKTQKEQWGKEFAATQQAQQWQQQWQQKQATSQARQQQLQWQLQQKAELTGEKDWIQYYMLHRGIEQQGAEESARKQFEKAQTKADEAWIAYSTALQGETKNPYITPGTFQFLQPGLDIARGEEISAGKTYEETARRPIGTPPAPDWLSQYVPSQVTGQPITKAPVRTPSGQMWAATSPTAQAGLAGYAEWAHPVSRSYADILAHMIQMQPEPVYGATTRRWQPARQ